MQWFNARSTQHIHTLTYSTQPYLIPHTLQQQQKNCVLYTEMKLSSVYWNIYNMRPWRGNLCIVATTKFAMRSHIVRLEKCWGRFFSSLYFSYSYITYNIGNMGSMSTHFHMPSQYLYSAHTFVYSKVANEIRELEKQKKIRAQKQIVLSRQTKKTSFSAIDRQIKNDNLSEYKDILSQ